LTRGTKEQRLLSPWSPVCPATAKKSLPLESATPAPEEEQHLDRRLRAISAVFAAAAGFDAKQTAPLHLFAAPMLKMNSPALRNEVEQRLMIALIILGIS